MFLGGLELGVCVRVFFCALRAPAFSFMVLKAIAASFIHSEALAARAKSVPTCVTGHVLLRLHLPTKEISSTPHSDMCS